jgi:hypothetical protein
VTRNYDRIQFERYRRKIDPKFNALHDELENCYYEFWKQGRSKPFQGYDVQPLREASKELFDQLHGLIFQEHLLALNQEHLISVEKEPKFEKYMKYDLRDKEGKIIKQVDRIAQAQQTKTQLNQGGISITIE